MAEQGFDVDVVVIGSGFGGSVMTCRLAEKGYRVCLLERGRRYGMFEFPRRMDEVRRRLFWDPEDGKFGFMQFHSYYESDVFSVAASGLGGGSLIYANVLMRMPSDFFAGWPGGITRETLDPYYDRALAMLEATPYPFGPDNPYYYDTPKTAAMQRAAESIADAPDTLAPHRFRLPHLAVRFEGDFPGQQGTNRQGVLQSRCTKCGECDLGCNIHAKNTLDLNYLARACSPELLGPGGVAAEIRTGALVREIIPLAGGGYEVRYVRPEAMAEWQKVTARRVVLSAGTIGSTAMLLKMRKYGRLDSLSPMLGQRWCGNGDLEGMVFRTDDQLLPTKGPVITSAIEYRFQSYDDGFPHGLYIQDAGIPAFVGWYAVGRLPSPGVLGPSLRFGARMLARFSRLGILRRLRREINIGDDIAAMIDRDDYLRHFLILLGMGRDRSDGRIELSEDDRPLIRWQMEGSRLHYDRVRREMRKIARSLGGKFVDNPLTWFDKIIAVHPLGGCVMAETGEEGVVDTNGEVFGHPGLYVVDASILPSSTGPNPSLTIAAMAERIADRFPESGPARS